MKTTVSLALWALVSGATALTAQYHQPIVLMGGYAPGPFASGSLGVFIADLRGATPTTQSILVTGGSARFSMDADNRHVLLATMLRRTSQSTGPAEGLFRVDPATSTYTTIFPTTTTPGLTYEVYDAIVDHNGDYLFGVREWRVPRPTAVEMILKIDRNGVVTTLIDGRVMPDFWASGPMQRDIDTGEVLVRAIASTAGVLRIDPDTGAVNTWSTGGAAGWYDPQSMPQSHANGYLEGLFFDELFQLTPGTGSRTTLATLNFATNEPGVFDLQTAPRRRWVYASMAPSFKTRFTVIDRPSFVLTHSAELPATIASRSLAFYRGRHTQSVRIVPGQWQVRMSAPAHPGKPYAITLGLSGVRPGVGLPGGRRVNLNLDRLSALALADGIRPLFQPGPGVLDAGGTATAHIDLRTVGRLGVALWVAWAVLDPRAPDGIAYLPDTYVMRV